MYQKLGEELKEILELEREPVAIKWLTKPPKNIEKEKEKSRFCQKLVKAADGDIFYSTVDTEACFGGMRHAGLKDAKEFPETIQSGEFLVKMGVFKSVPAFQRARKKSVEIEPGFFKAMVFAPLVKAEFEPDIVFIICNPQQGMEILHANTYDSGRGAIGAGSGAICGTMAAEPYLTGEITYGFGDTGARSFMDLKPDEAMVSIPASELSRVVSNLKEIKSRSHD
jgi:uncharacterized protein (DUF169 family)